MINFEKLEKRLKTISKKVYLIKKSTKISYKDLLKLQEISKNYEKKYFNECIEGGINGEWNWCEGPIYFTVEDKCTNCDCLFTSDDVSKDRLLSRIYRENNHWFNFINVCPSCKEKENLEKKKKNAFLNSPEYKKAQNEIRNNNTEDFKKIYLDENRSFKSDVNYYEKYETIISMLNKCDEDEIAKYILEMDYLDFLQTPYWDAIRSKKLYLSGYKCSLCNKTKGLQVHHKTYKNHGFEHNNLDDLIVLCQSCHSKHHDKEI